MVFVCLGHVAEDPGGGERENFTKFCAFLSMLKIRIRILRYLDLRDPDSLVLSGVWIRIKILSFSHEDVERTCLATATISYPASLSNPPNGYQGHPRLCLSAGPDPNYVLTRSTLLFNY